MCFVIWHRIFVLFNRFDKGKDRIYTQSTYTWNLHTSSCRIKSMSYHCVCFPRSCNTISHEGKIISFKEIRDQVRKRVVEHFQISAWFGIYFIKSILLRFSTCILIIHDLLTELDSFIMNFEGFLASHDLMIYFLRVLRSHSNDYLKASFNASTWFELVYWLSNIYRLCMSSRQHLWSCLCRVS